MRKKITVLLCLAVVLVQGCSREDRISKEDVLNSATDVAEPSTKSEPDSEPVSETSIKDDINARRELHSIYVEDDYMALLESATDEEKLLIEKMEKEGIRPANWYPRKVYTILGVIPEDHTRISREQVQDILDEMQENKLYTDDSFYNMELLQAKLDTIAGGADYDGGNERKIKYYLDDEGEKYICINSGLVTYHEKDDLQGEYMGTPYNKEDAAEEKEMIFDDYYAPKLKCLESGTYSKEELWEACYKAATDNQKKELDALVDKYGEEAHCYIYKLLEITDNFEVKHRIDRYTIDFYFNDPFLNTVPKHRILLNTKSMIDEMIPPNFCGVDKEDGVYKAIYYTDDEENECYEISASGVVYVNKSGEREQLYKF